MNVLLWIQYHGKNFYGSQIQPKGRTVQGELELALKRCLNEDISTIFSGRTDAGVHAYRQAINFHTTTNIPADRIAYAVRRFLPDDITSIESKLVDDNFNARYDAKSRSYKYFITQEYDLFKADTSLYYPYDLNYEKIVDATKVIVGKKDFQAFCSAKSDVKSFECDITKLDIEKKGSDLIIEISANRFLHNMVRIIVSILLEVGSGKIVYSEIDSIIQSKDRRNAPKTVSPSGLFLYKIEY